MDPVRSQIGHLSSGMDLLKLEADPLRQEMFRFEHQTCPLGPAIVPRYPGMDPFMVWPFRVMARADPG